MRKSLHRHNAKMRRMANQKDWAQHREDGCPNCGYEEDRHGNCCHYGDAFPDHSSAYVHCPTCGMEVWGAVIDWKGRVVDFSHAQSRPDFRGIFKYENIRALFGVIGPDTFFRLY